MGRGREGGDGLHVELAPDEPLRLGHPLRPALALLGRPGLVRLSEDDGGERPAPEASDGRPARLVDDEPLPELVLARAGRPGELDAGGELERARRRREARDEQERLGRGVEQDEEVRQASAGAVAGGVRGLRTGGDCGGGGGRGGRRRPDLGADDPPPELDRRARLDRAGRQQVEQRDRVGPDDGERVVCGRGEACAERVGDGRRRVDLPWRGGGGGTEGRRGSAVERRREESGQEQSADRQ